ncbi:MAG TPA: NADPH-dependent F420 reductase [Acidimicrobiales bacterium]|nr:NADPH-dependent F420 reductase [Acidimicrobiales bacterium]
MTTVGILGGTGAAGRGVAIRLASAGYSVVIGSRDETRAREIASTLHARGDGAVRGASNDAAAACDLVIVATPWDSAVATVSAVRSSLANKTVVSMVNALAREGKELVPIYPPRGSMAAQLAFALPESVVVGAFHHLPASEMENLDSGLDADVVIFSDDDGAREAVARVVDEMPGLHAIVAGSMSLASAVEGFTSVCVSINIRHKVHSYVKFAGFSH